MDRTAHIAQRIVGARIFEYGIIALILASGALLGLATSPAIVDQYGDAIAMGNRVILGVFIVEAALKMLALAPTSQRYFRDGWNVFDFAIIVFALVPATGSFAMVARLGRLLRVLRLISAIKELRLIVGALVRSIPSVANIMMLMSIVVYIYASSATTSSTRPTPRTGARSAYRCCRSSASSRWRTGRTSCTPRWSTTASRGSTSSASWSAARSSSRTSSSRSSSTTWTRRRSTS